MEYVEECMTSITLENLIFLNGGGECGVGQSPDLRANVRANPLAVLGSGGAESAILPAAPTSGPGWLG